MAPRDDGSVTRWIGDLKAGGDSAAQHLWARYFHRLVDLARSRLRSTPLAGAIEDEEDAALSAFDSFCRGVAWPTAASPGSPNATTSGGCWSSSQSARSSASSTAR
jgi:hypothetical protein